MARSRYNRPAFFLDEELADLGPTHFILYRGLETQADRDGRLEDRPRRLKAAILPWYEVDVDNMLDDLAGIRKVLRYVAAEGLKMLWLPDFLRDQNPHRNEPESELPGPSNDDVEGLSRLIAITPERERSAREDFVRDVKSKSKSKSRVKEDARARELCEQLAARIVENGTPESRVLPISQAWLDEARLMLDRDGRDEAEARRLIDWCQQDGFWRGNVLSMPKFRKQYDQLRLRAPAPLRGPMRPADQLPPNSIPDEHRKLLEDALLDADPDAVGWIAQLRWSAANGHLEIGGQDRAVAWVRSRHPNTIDRVASELGYRRAA